MFRFTITTNGMLLSDENIDYINREMSNVVLSLDGRKDVNDHMRPTAGGKGSYDVIVPKFQKLVAGRGTKDYYARGTFTRENLDFAQDVMHLASLGFRHVSVEPASGPLDDPFAIKEEDLDQVDAEYEKLARELADRRAAEQKEQQFSAYKKVTLDNLFSQMAQNDMKELAIVVKADVQGSAEAVKQSLEKISNDEVRVRVIHAGVGAISKSDVDLADASNAIIIGFNVRPDNVAKEEAAATKVEMRMYRVIYDAINDVTDAMKGMLAPKFREVSLGELQVRQVYKISNVGTVAGCRVTSGKITRDSKVRVVRDGIVITEDEIASLKRFKDDAKEVAEGYECGVTLEKFADVKEGDVYEAFKMEEYRD